MQQLLHQCVMVVTDSGGLQKEAYFHEKPSLVVREETEWLELVEAGLARLVGTDPEKMKASFDAFRTSELDFGRDLYGKEPGARIYDEIAAYLNR